MNLSEFSSLNRIKSFFLIFYALNEEKLTQLGVETLDSIGVSRALLVGSRRTESLIESQLTSGKSLELGLSKSSLNASVNGSEVTVLGSRLL